MVIMEKEHQERREKLVIYNSISRKKEKFITQKSGLILWYNCGPTVYDSSHMGHARSYISLDIIRRILAHYFGYRIDYVMNITDIDDKIIRKARQLYLFDTYKSEVTCGNHSASAFDEDIKKAIAAYETKYTKEDDPDKKAMMSRLLEECKTNQSQSTEETINIYKEILYDYLDNQRGSTVTDNEIFTNVPRKYEAEFFDDMRNLNVMEPETLTRVSEYVPQIVTYIVKIISNGYAYESNQSVYFDTAKFSSSSKHNYAKLSPESVGDNKAQSEGEGVLFSGIQDKRHPNDFALWKKSKPGEPSWDSPWGKGRPGWHIECSVMASDTLGSTLDIHSGGCDLKFPHHDNEMAQSEAYYDTGDNWVNYFLHTGHLTISGCKMSKSLKNFITINDALKKHSWRQLRLAFLLHAWNATLDYGDTTMREALAFEKSLNKFLWSIKWTLINLDSSDKFSSKETILSQRLEETKQRVENFICDNFNTVKSLECVNNLISATRDYLKDDLSPNRKILLDVTHYIFDLMKVFGAWEKDTKAELTSSSMVIEEVILPFISEIVNFRQEMRQIGLDKKENDIIVKCDKLKENLVNLGIQFTEEEISGKMSTTIKVSDRETLLKEIEKMKKTFDENGLPSMDKEEAILPFVQVIANFRQEMRQIGLDKKDSVIMVKCDQLREKLVDLGVELEDDISILEKMFTLFRIMDRETLKKQEEAEKLEKERKKKELEEAQKAKDAKKSIPPTQLFINQTDKYSAFDEKGLPTLDIEGKPISKSALKKLIKLYEQQEKKYEEYLKSSKGNIKV